MIINLLKIIWVLPINVSSSKGNLIHFVETHDNNRLAETSDIFAKLRVGICSLNLHKWSFGFSNGVEWLAKEKSMFIMLIV